MSKSAARREPFVDPSLPCNYCNRDMALGHHLVCARARKLMRLGKCCLMQSIVEPDGPPVVAGFGRLVVERLALAAALAGREEAVRQSDETWGMLESCRKYRAELEHDITRYANITSDQATRILELEKELKSAASTMEEQVRRLLRWGKSHDELDGAIVAIDAALGPVVSGK